MNAVRRCTGALLIALVVGALVPGGVRAASSRTVYVDDNGAANAAAKGKCGKPNYSTIQAAVNDLSAKHIIVCKGTYTEQVTVERSVTLEGRSGATIHAPVNAVEAIVRFNGPQKSRLTGFTISGAASTTLLAGVLVYGFVCEDTPCGPTNVTISNNHVSDIVDTSESPTSGIGILVNKAQADVSDNTVERYGYVGIVADGSDRADTFAQIDGNTIRGQGAGSTIEKQVGIRLDETKADVEDNTISGNRGFEPDGIGVGILVEYANGSIRDNTVTDNRIGVKFVPGSSIELRSNEIRNNASHGIVLVHAFQVKVVENESSHNGGDGIRVEDNAVYESSNLIATNNVHDNNGNGILLTQGLGGNAVKGNKAHHNGGTDIVDANGTPLVNTYADNSCDTSNPNGLCED